MSLFTPPFKEDFFERVVDVQWKKRGAVFVAGDVCCFNWYIKAQMRKGKPEIEFQALGSLSFTDSGSTDGAAAGAVGKNKRAKIAGQPTFCLGGSHGEGEGDSAVTICTVETSRDGLSWSTTYNETFGKDEDGPDMNGGNWDGHQFNIGELTSSDGYGWSRGGGGGTGDQGGTNEKGVYHSAGEFGFDYLVYAGGVWCGAAGQSVMIAFEDEEGNLSFQSAGSTNKYDVSCLCGVALEDFPKDQR